MMQQPPSQPSDQTSQYQQQHQQWMAYQQQSQQQQQQHQTPVPPPVGWTPQPVPPPSQQTQPYGVAPDASSDGIRSLWIGDLQPWMEESYIASIFGHTGEGRKISFAGNNAHIMSWRSVNMFEAQTW